MIDLETSVLLISCQPGVPATAEGATPMHDVAQVR
jgi:hypothetical protein